MPTSFDERYKQEAECLFDAKCPLEIQAQGEAWALAPQEIVDLVYSSIGKGRAIDLGHGAVVLSSGARVRFRLPSSQG